jgi:chaperonin cofactor prefoldin
MAKIENRIENLKKNMEDLDKKIETLLEQKETYSKQLLKLEERLTAKLTNSKEVNK